MLRRVSLIAALVTALAVVLPCGPVGAQSRDSIERAARDSIRSLGLQTELPKKSEPFRVPIPAELIYIAFFCAIALILWSLRDSIPGWGRRDGAWEGAENGGTATGAAEIDALAAADRLSREGRLVEAMHMLLLQSLADLRALVGDQFADSLTSREIVRAARLPAAGRSALRAIVTAVERTYFGGYPAAPADYATCRDNFESLRSVLRGGAPA